MGLFKGMKGRRGKRGGGPYFNEEPDGLWKVKLNRITSHDKRAQGNMPAIPCFSVESVVIESPTNETVKPGMLVSNTIKMAGEWDFLGAIADFLRAAMYAQMVQAGEEFPSDFDWEAEDPDEDDAENAISEEQPLAGTILCVRTRTVTRPGKEPFTYVNWFPPEEE